MAHFRLQWQSTRPVKHSETHCETLWNVCCAVNNGWSITAEGGKSHNKADQRFEEIVADLANTRFNKTVFEGTATAGFWVGHCHGNLLASASQSAKGEMGDGRPNPRSVEIRTNHYMVGVAWDVQIITAQSTHGLCKAHVWHVFCKVTAPNWCSSNIESCMNDKTRQQNLECTCTAFVSSWKTPSPGDLDTVINQLVFRGQGDLEQFVEVREERKSGARTFVMTLAGSKAMRIHSAKSCTRCSVSPCACASIVALAVSGVR